MENEDLSKVIDAADRRSLYLNQLGHIKERFRIAEFVDAMQERHSEALNEYADKYERLMLASDNQEMLEATGE